jgi:hypothetical protein
VSTSNSIGVAALESGFADYLICSFLGKSKVGQEFVVKYDPSMLQRGYVVDVANEEHFVRDYLNEPPLKTEPHAAGRAWSGAFWEIRNMLGCDPTVPQCEAADKILLSSWAILLSSWAEFEVEIDEHFAQTVIRNITSDGGSEKGAKARSIFERRGLKLS